jgi:hypothetical protein
MVSLYDMNGPFVLNKQKMLTCLMSIPIQWKTCPWSENEILVKGEKVAIYFYR